MNYEAANEINRLLDVIAELNREIDKLRADAERYAFLKKHFTGYSYLFTERISELTVQFEIDGDATSDLDAAIDAALKAEAAIKTKASKAGKQP